MNAVLTPDGQPNWNQVGNQRWELQVGDDTMGLYLGNGYCNLYRNKRFHKRFEGEDCVEQANVNILRQIERQK